MSAESSPVKVVALADTSPATVATAQHQGQANASPVGTEHFASYASSEAPSEVGNVMAWQWPPRQALPPVWWDPNGPPNQGPPKEIPEHEAETPPKTVLPADYDATTGTTPLGAEGWQVTNHRVNFKRPKVPGHSAVKPFCLATPTKDQP